MSGGKGRKQGVPQGGVVSPLLANLYINRFLKHWRWEVEITKPFGRASSITRTTS